MTTEVTEADLPALPVPVTVAKGRIAEVTHERPMEVLGVLAPWALRHGYPLADISVHRPSLEEIYLRLTAEAAERAGRPLKYRFPLRQRQGGAAGERKGASRGGH